MMCTFIRKISKNKEKWKTHCIYQWARRFTPSAVLPTTYHYVSTYGTSRLRPRISFSRRGGSEIHTACMTRNLRSPKTVTTHLNTLSCISLGAPTHRYKALGANDALTVQATKPRRYNPNHSCGVWFFIQRWYHQQALFAKTNPNLWTTAGSYHCNSMRPKCAKHDIYRAQYQNLIIVKPVAIVQ